MKNHEDATHFNFSVKKSWLKVLSFAFVAVLATVISIGLPQNDDDFKISKAGILPFAGMQSSTQQGKYAISSSSANMDGSIMTHIVILNTETGQSKFYQLFNDKYGSGWKVIELSSSKYNLGIPKVNF